MTARKGGMRRRMRRWHSKWLVGSHQLMLDRLRLIAK